MLQAQGLQAARQGHILQAMLETCSESQGLPAARQSHVLQALIEIHSEAQAENGASQGCWPGQERSGRPLMVAGRARSAVRSL